MKKQSNDSAAIAAFLASKGATKVPEGASNGMSDKAWYRAARDVEPTKVVADYSVEDALYEREHEIGAAYGVEGVNDFRLGVAKHGGKAMLGWK